MVEQVASQASLWDILLVVALVAGVLWYWWSRKAAKHPDYAAAKEAELDAALQWAKKYAPDVVDTLLDRAAAINLTAAGQASYVVLDRKVKSLQAQIDELKAKLPK